MAEEKPEVLDAVLKETIDLENIPIEEVLENLRCSKEGLSSEAAEERLAIFGHNKLEEKQVTLLIFTAPFFVLHKLCFLLHVLTIVWYGCCVSREQVFQVFGLLLLFFLHCLHFW
ncbi:plasma membrane ATPase 1-like [Rosa rugosa]|uniref:plasma membrane ATPase 1-like n=1 Tax=Rosa rugosa TaxID=74645 RepID=UPI002B40DF76|nr:plasma membrane ATPase 1-like [Rosa rugosa]